MLLDDFLRELASRGATEDTIKNCRYKITQFSRWLGQVPVSDITEQDIKDYLTTHSHWSVNSRTAHIGTLKIFFTWAADKEYVEESPVANIPTPRPRRGTRRSLRPDDVQKLLGACSRPVERAVIGLGVYAGLRTIEKTNLKVDDIEQDILHVRGKGGYNRVIPIAPKLKRIIDECVPRHVNGNDRLIPFSRGYLGELVSKIGRRAGVKVSPHILRHTFATRALQTSGDLRSIQLLLGHSNLSTTEIYLHSDPEQRRAIVEKLF